MTDDSPSLGDGATRRTAPVMTAMSAFVARHVERSGHFTVAVAPEAAFGLFSPEGERGWAPGWDPEYLHPRDGVAVPGLAFRTAAGGESTLWLVLRYDGGLRQAEYVRIVPESRYGIVRVACVEAAEGQTSVAVTYSLTATSEAGNRVLDELTEPAFAAMMEEWRAAIERLLGQSRPPR